MTQGFPVTVSMPNRRRERLHDVGARALKTHMADYATHPAIGPRLPLLEIGPAPFPVCRTNPIQYVSVSCRCGCCPPIAVPIVVHAATLQSIAYHIVATFLAASASSAYQEAACAVVEVDDDDEEEDGEIEEPAMSEAVH